MIAHAYVPTSGDGATRQHLARMVTDRWGGLTVYPCLGQMRPIHPIPMPTRWCSASGKLVTERVDTWEVACHGHKRGIKLWWQEFANTAKRVLKQEQFMVALFDGDAIVSEEGAGE